VSNSLLLRKFKTHFTIISQTNNQTTIMTSTVPTKKGLAFTINPEIGLAFTINTEKRTRIMIHMSCVILLRLDLTFSHLNGFLGRRQEAGAKNFCYISDISRHINRTRDYSVILLKNICP